MAMYRTVRSTRMNELADLVTGALAHHHYFIQRVEAIESNTDVWTDRRLYFLTSSRASNFKPTSNACFKRGQLQTSDAECDGINRR
jgi:hypothetical protein